MFSIQAQAIFPHSSQYNPSKQYQYLQAQPSNSQLSTCFHYLHHNNLSKIQLRLAYLSSTQNPKLQKQNDLINGTYIQKIFKLIEMSFPILQSYQTEFPAHAALIVTFQGYYNKKLWYELSNAILHFIYQNDVKGKLSFNFYTDFVKKFDKNIDQISHLKIIKECLAKMPASIAIEFLEKFEKNEAITDETKAIAAGLRANYYIEEDPSKCSELYHRLEKFVRERKDADNFAFSTFYRFAFNYFLSKNKQKLYYENALQYLAYTSAEEMQQNYKIKLLENMGIAILTSPEIYNFSELLEQPSLKSLDKSQYKWVYELLNIFNQGDINTFTSVIDDASNRDKRLKDNRKALEQKIRLMAFLELVFNLPKSNRTVSLAEVSRKCGVEMDHVEFMIMKAAALKLVRVQIDQIQQTVTITWIAPKVLGGDRIDVMTNKFQQWENGIKQVSAFIHENWKIKA